MTDEKLQLLAIERRETELLRLKAQELKENRLQYYTPHKFQTLFHEAGHFHLRLAEAGNRSGKSEMGAAEDAAWMLGERLWYPTGHPMRKLGIPDHAVKGLVICTSWQKVKEVYTDNTPGNEAKMFRYLPSSRIHHTAKKGEVVYFISLDNGSSITFITVEAFKKNPQTMESSDWDFIHVDEPCPEPMYKGAARGLIDRNGKAWFTLTPLEQPWISDLFFPSTEDHTQVEVYEKDTQRPLRFAVSFSMLDNPFTTEEGRNNYIATLSEEEKECRISGKPFNLVGLVYKEFSPERHVMIDKPETWERWNKPPITYSYYIFIDPHPRTPWAIQFWAVPPGSARYYLYDEIFQQAPPSLIARDIKSRIVGLNVLEIYMDPLGFIEDPETSNSFADRFFNEGLPVMKATKDLHNGIIVAKEKLLIDGQVRITPHCQRTLWEFRRYRWDNDKKSGAPLNKPIDKDDHMMENFYRAMLADMIYVDPATNSLPIREEAFTHADYSLSELSYDL